VASDELTRSLEQLEFEVSTLWREFQATDWYGNTPHFPFVHHGYMMAIFSRVDLLSRYWAGYDRPQMPRMVGFLDRYVHPGTSEENCVAVQLWRHTVMHTGEARRLLDATTQKRYTWRLDFGSGAQLISPHYSIYYDSGDELWVLVIVVAELVADLKQGQARYLGDLAANVGGLQANYQSQDPAIQLQPFKSSRCR
jgi:hypothetical protein